MQRGDGRIVFCRLPRKFGKLMWIKTGDYVIMERDVTEEEELERREEEEEEKEEAKETEEDGKDVDVSLKRGEVAHILRPAQIRHLQSLDGVWPERFVVEGRRARREDGGESEEEEEEEDGEYEWGAGNPNRIENDEFDGYSSDEVTEDEEESENE